MKKSPRILDAEFGLSTFFDVFSWYFFETKKISRKKNLWVHCAEQMTDLLAGLNPAQRSAAEVLTGPLLIIAGAGSGKTKTLTHRIAHLIDSGVHPSEILAVTFTNKAAGEMKERIAKMLGATSQPAVGTFHSICVRMLREDIEKLDCGLTRSFEICDTDDIQKLIKQITKELDIDEKQFKPRPIASFISSNKNMLMTPQKFAHEQHRSPLADVVAKIWPIFERKMLENNALDFDDLLQKTVQVLESSPEALAKYRKRWNHLMVDEYQDTNFAQYRMVRLLADGHQNLCVIGDDHQSIYSFRGADYTNILNFEKDFPKAKTIKLEQNYRSTKHILKNANALISYNETGRPKKLWTDNTPGEKVRILEMPDDRMEGNAIAESIAEHVRAGGHARDCAVLYRMNAQSRSIEEALMRRQIPYQIVGGTRFFDRKEIKDVVAYLRLIANPRSDLAFLRIINTPTRKIGAATLEVIQRFAQNYTMSLLEVLEHVDEIDELNDSKKSALRGFRDLIIGLKKESESNPVSIVLDRVVEKTKFLEYLDDGSSEGEARQQNVKELFSVAARYDTAEDSLATFLEGVALISDLDQVDSSDTVTLMTIHASKGLEFPVVFLPGWEENMFPSSRANDDRNALEEERRLGYVAITRAEKQCTISHAQQRMLFGMRQYNHYSRFLDELDASCTERESQKAAHTPSRTTTNTGKKSVEPFSDEYPSTMPPPTAAPQSRREAIFGIADASPSEFKISDAVRHADFGEGTIIQVSGDVLTVAFSGRGVKKIVASVAPIEKI